MTCLTKTELENAERDVSDLSAVINGPSSGGASTVTTRLGVVIKTLARVIYETSIPTASAIVGLLDTYFGSTAWRDVSSPLTTKGDIYGFSTVNARLPVGSNNQVLTADSSQALGVKWATGITGAASSNVLKAGDIMTGLLGHAVGSLASQQIIRAISWNGGNARWKEVLEADAGYGLYNYDSSGAGAFRVLYIPPNGSSNPAQFQSNLTVLGNVSIGTSAQNDKLQVAGAVLSTAPPSNASGANGFMFAGILSPPVLGRLYLGDGSGWRLEFAKRSASVDTPLFAFTDTGKFGVGYSAPVNPCYIGSGFATPATPSTYALAIGDTSGNPAFTLGAVSGQTLFQTWSGNALVINSQGNNVAIGNIVPTATLTVNGTIRCASYTVATLPSAATVGDGSRAQVTDANATTFHNAVAGGGANNVSVIVCGGTWRIGG